MDENRIKLLWALLLVLFRGCNLTNISSNSNEEPFERITDFKQLISSKNFVDKTLIVKALFESYPYNYVTSPHGFGKTSNLDLLRRFLQIEINQTTGQRVEDKKTTENYKLFTDPHLNLKIAQNKTFIDKHLGEHPVIHINFRNIDGDSFREMLKQTGRELQKTFGVYDWLPKFLLEKLPSNYHKLPSIKRRLKMFAAIMDGNFTLLNIDRSLKILSELIHLYFGQRAILLVDGYDTPVITCMIKRLEKDLPDVHLLTESVFRPVLVGSYRVEYAFITGICYLAESLKLSLIMTLRRWRFLDGHNFAEFFGFTENEVSKVFDRYEIGVQEREEVREFYNSYIIFNYHTYVPLYNSYDVTHYLKYRSFENYQADMNVTKVIPIFFKYVDFRKEILNLLFQGVLPIQIYYNLTLESKLNYLAFTDNRSVVDEYFVMTDFAITFLIESGYMVRTGEMIDQYQQLIRIPNMKSKMEIDKHLKIHYNKEYGLNITHNSVVDNLRLVVQNENTSEKIINDLNDAFNVMIKPFLIKRLGRELLLNSHEFHSLIFCLTFYNFPKVFLSTKKLNFKKVPDYGQDPIREPDVLISGDDERIALVIEITFHDDVDEAVRHAKQYTTMSQCSKIKVVKFLGVDLTSENVIQVKTAPNHYIR